MELTAPLPVGSMHSSCKVCGLHASVSVFGHNEMDACNAREPISNLAQSMALWFPEPHQNASLGFLLLSGTFVLVCAGRIRVCTFRGQHKGCDTLSGLRGKRASIAVEDQPNRPFEWPQMKYEAIQSMRYWFP